MSSCNKNDYFRDINKMNTSIDLIMCLTNSHPLQNIPFAIRHAPGTRANKQHMETPNCPSLYTLPLLHEICTES